MIQDFWATFACLEKQCALNPLYWNIFYHSGFLSNLRLPWKQTFPWQFSCRMDGSPHTATRLVRLCLQLSGYFCSETEIWILKRQIANVPLIINIISPLTHWHNFSVNFFTVFGSWLSILMYCTMNFSHVLVCFSTRFWTYTLLFWLRHFFCFNPVWRHKWRSPPQRTRGEKSFLHCLKCQRNFCGLRVFTKIVQQCQYISYCSP